MDAEDALLIIDVQSDFCPGGALPVEGGGEVVPELNRWIRAARAGGARVVASRDWHPPRHVSFQQQGGRWPAHCIQHTAGAAFHPDLELPDDAQIVSKGMARDRDEYSAFEHTGLGDQLRRQGVRRLWIGGLAQDICVRATVLDARKAGFEVHLIRPATRPVDPEGGRQAIREMQESGAVIEESLADEGRRDA